MNPLVSIGLPVYNGERYLERAVRSILRQTYPHFELIICDNASVDGTEDLCRRLAAEDGRIRYYRNVANIGAGPNFNRTFALSRGTYFKWAAHDDLLEPTYLSRCVEVLESDPTVVLCHSRLIWIGEEDEFKKEYNQNLPGAESRRVCRRFFTLASLTHGCFDVFGLMRRDVLAETDLIASYTGSDRALLAELGLRGRYHRVPAVLFLSRDHSARSLRAMTFYGRRQWWDTSLAGAVELPYWRLLGRCAASVRRAPLSAWQKLCCWLMLPLWVRHSWRFLLGDLTNALAVIRRSGALGRMPRASRPPARSRGRDAAHRLERGLA